MSEDSIRRAFSKMDEGAGVSWLQQHLDYSVAPLLGEHWVLDIDSTVTLIPTATIITDIVMAMVGLG